MIFDFPVSSLLFIDIPPDLKFISSLQVEYRHALESIKGSLYSAAADDVVRSVGLRYLFALSSLSTWLSMIFGSSTLAEDLSVHLASLDAQALREIDDLVTASMSSLAALEKMMTLPVGKRHYHTTRHVFEILAVAAAVAATRSPADAPDAADVAEGDSVAVAQLAVGRTVTPATAVFIAAAFYHDAIYAADAPKGDSERASAAAVEVWFDTIRAAVKGRGLPLGGGGGGGGSGSGAADDTSLARAMAALQMIERHTVDIILATIDHKVPAGGGGAETPEEGAEGEQTGSLVRGANATVARALCGLFLDLDLVILASPPGRYEEYLRDVRQEYGHLSDTEWASGRGSFAKSFAERERVFVTTTLADALTEQVRENLRGEAQRWGGCVQ